MKKIHTDDPSCKQKAPQSKDNVCSPKKGRPERVILYTRDEEKSKAVVTAAMAEMYMRMIHPL